jgi:hypothetical protein
MKYFFTLVLLAFCSTVFSQPVITSFSPLTAPPGTQLIIRGSNFGSTTTSNIVYFGAARATLISATDTSVVAIVPFGATHSNITLTTGNLIAYSQKKFVAALGKGGSITPSAFTAKQDFIAGDFIEALTAGDFDGDGRVDIAAANYSDATISVFRNLSIKPTISFGTKINLPATQNPGDLKSADMDGDGKLDLVSCNDASKTVSVFRNTSTARFHIICLKSQFPDRHLCSRGSTWGH